MRDSDASVIFTVRPELTGGSELRPECAAKHGKPWLHVGRDAQGDAARRLREFLATHAVKVQNVAGSRASKEPEVAKFVDPVLTLALDH